MLDSNDLLYKKLIHGDISETEFDTYYDSFLNDELNDPKIKMIFFFVGYNEYVSTCFENKNVKLYNDFLKQTYQKYFCTISAKEFEEKFGVSL
jgi:hypothetical protein